MHIKNRIKRIENNISDGNPVNCQCRIYKGKVYPLSEFILEIDGIQTIENPVADNCESCGKPVEKEQFIIEFV